MQVLYQFFSLLKVSKDSFLITYLSKNDFLFGFYFSSANAVVNSISAHSFVNQAGTPALQRSEIYTERNHLNNSFVHAAMDGSNLLVQQRATGIAPVREDPSTSYYSPHLPPVSEEPSSSCSEGIRTEYIRSLSFSNRCGFSTLMFDVLESCCCTCSS